MTRPKQFTCKATPIQSDEFLRLCRELIEQSPNVDEPEINCQIDVVIVYDSLAVDGITDFGNGNLW